MKMALGQAESAELGKELPVSWFTSTGKIMPLMLKIEDEDGEIQTIRDIIVHSQEKRDIPGFPP